MKLFGRSKKTKQKTEKKEKNKTGVSVSKIKSKQGSVKKIDDLPARSLVFPHVSEKATRLAEKNKYIFKVFLKTNKNQIKRAVEKLYGVEVKNVNIVNVKRKKRRLGRIEGYKSGYKKAIVTLKEGHKIELVPR